MVRWDGATVVSQSERMSAGSTSRCDPPSDADGPSGQARPGENVVRGPAGRVRQASKWGKQEHAGSLAEHLTMWILLARRVSWRRPLPTACATGFVSACTLAVLSVFFSGMVISNDNKSGSIEIVFAIMPYLIALGIVVIPGAVFGLVGHERDLSLSAAFRKLRRTG